MARNGLCADVCAHLRGQTMKEASAMGKTMRRGEEASTTPSLATQRSRTADALEAAGRDDARIPSAVDELRVLAVRQLRHNARAVFLSPESDRTP